MAKRSKFPPMLRMTTNEAECISNMFRLYDTHCTGRIANHFAEKLAHTIGLKQVDRHMFSGDVSLNELLLTLD
ncbi:hypothetical protein EON65_59395, partial [archaeon]